MRITVLGNYPPSKGGLETFLGAYVPELARRGHDVTVISEAGQLRDIRSDNVRIFGSPMSDILIANDIDRLTVAVKRMKNVMRESDPEVIHLHPSGANLLFFRMILKSFSDCPKILTFHGGLAEEEYLNHVQSLVADCDVITAVSDHVASNVPGSPVVVENALPLPTPAGPLPDAPDIMGLGRLVEQKGFVVAVDALALVQAELPAATLTIAGLGPEQAKLQDRAARCLARPEGLRCTGWVGPDQKRDLFAAAQCVVVPSLWEEPFGLVALEAAMYGRAAIVSDRGELPRIVKHGKTGLVVPGNDPVALSQAILRLLRNPVEAAAMGKAARQWAEARFDFGRMMDIYETILRDAVARRVIPVPEAGDPSR